jgi:hypothetical protein
MSSHDLAAIAEALPYPLGLKLQTLRAEARVRAGGGSPGNLAFTVAAFNGLALRLAALVSLHAYVRTGASDNGVNQLIVDKLRQPADGAWREVTAAILPRVSSDPHAARIAQWLTTSAAVPEGGLGWDAPRLALSPSIVAFFGGAAEGASRQARGRGLPKAGTR